MTNVVSFKQAMDSVTVQDINNLNTAKQSKPVQKQLDIIKSGKYTKSDINSLTKLVGGARFATVERKAKIQALLNLAFNYVHDEYISSNFQCDFMFFKRGGLKITSDQTELGKEWLKNHFYKKNNTPRSGKNTEHVSDRVLKISKSVSRFEFVGICLVKNPYGDCNQVLPVYRTFNRKGEYFDYSPIHWGQPVIVEGL